MSPEQLDLLQASMVDLPDQTAVAGRFFDLLERADPSTRALFHHRPETDRKFAAELGQLIGCLDDLDRLEARARSLGARHRAYGVTSRHYALAGEALVGAVVEQLGPRSSPAVVAAWRAAFDLIAETMMDGAAGG